MSEELREGLRRIGDGDIPRPVEARWRADGKPSKLDSCPHGIAMCDDCRECVQNFIDTLLSNSEQIAENANCSAEMKGLCEATAWRDVKAERQRQIDAEGWTAEHDDSHDDGALAAAAACYAVGRRIRTARYWRGLQINGYNYLWPWDSQWWKPKDLRSNLVRAAALLLAEIERVDRAAIARTALENAKGGGR